jgi:hypothetical protein
VNEFVVLKGMHVIAYSSAADRMVYTNENCVVQLINQIPAVACWWFA